MSQQKQEIYEKFMNEAVLYFVKNLKERSQKKFI